MLPVMTDRSCVEDRPRAPPEGAAGEPAHWKRHPDSEQGPGLRW